jgi:glucose/arabinose dehydrogenase/PKD repeat protein
MKSFLVRSFFLLFFSLCTFTFLYGQLPEDFYEEVWDTDFERLTGVCFDEEGRGFVWERSGLVHRLDTNGIRLPDPLLDIREEVADWWDMGMLGLTLDPGFQDNGRFYVLYSADRHHVEFFGTPDYDPDLTITNEATIARITRFTADPATDFTTLVPNSRKVLVGQTLSSGIPLLFKTHGMGALVFGTDGTLLVSCGDSSYPDDFDTGNDPNSYYEQALADGIIREAENVGAYRSQMINSLNGKILRIDPETGEGIASNPFFDSDQPRAARSLVWALGLRNPYRFTLMPNTGSHYPGDGNPGVLVVGDVGSNKWEELNLVTKGGQNFGWPLYEGFAIREPFAQQITPNQDAPNPLFDNDQCASPFFNFQDLLFEDHQNPPPPINPCDPSMLIPADITTFTHTRPAMAYRNRNGDLGPKVYIGQYGPDGEALSISMENPNAGLNGEVIDGTCSMAGVFYEEGNFPDEYKGRYFHIDFSGWLKLIDFDDNLQPIFIEPFYELAEDITSIAVHPKQGCLYYIDIRDNELRRICYGGTPAPLPVIDADATFGPSPLNVQFSAAASSTVTNAPLTYFWDFGDGTQSSEQEPLHTFTTPDQTPTPFEVQLTVTDTAGQSRTAKRIISINNTPPKAEITSIPEGMLYPLSSSTLLMLRGTATDAEQQPSELTYQWRTFLHHNDHFHTGLISNEQTPYALISPLGCGDEPYWYRVELEVSDGAGLSSQDSRLIYPYCGPDFPGWIYLTSEPQEKAVRLEWKVDQESNIVSYEIQRSADFFHFDVLGQLQATQGSGVYSFVDQQPIKGENIYRIKAVQSDGAISFSTLETISFPNTGNIRLYPNPFTDQLQIEIQRVRSASLPFRLFDSVGRVFFLQSIDAIPNQPLSIELSMSDLPAGIYFYVLENGTERVEGKLLKINP